MSEHKVGALKIKTVVIDGETRVPPEVMELLIAFGEHARICSECEAVQKRKAGAYYCKTGEEIMLQVQAHPDVEVISNEEANRLSCPGSTGDLPMM